MQAAVSQTTNKKHFHCAHLSSPGVLEVITQELFYRINIWISLINLDVFTKDSLVLLRFLLLSISIFCQAKEYTRSQVRYRMAYFRLTYIQIWSKKSLLLLLFRLLPPSFVHLPLKG